MEMQAPPTSPTAEAALKLNRALANRVDRWKRVRFIMAVGLTAAGTGLLFADAWAIFSVPLFLAAFLALLLYFDARDEVREVRARKWEFPTPKMSRLKNRKPLQAQDSPTAER
jgi:hypothetical protein